jgi:hypothetical protein
VSVNTDLGFQYTLSMPTAAEPFLPRTALSCRWAVVSPSACCYRQRGRADCHCRRMCHPAGAAACSTCAQTATGGGTECRVSLDVPLAGGRHMLLAGTGSCQSHNMCHREGGLCPARPKHLSTDAHAAMHACSRPVHQIMLLLPWPFCCKERCPAHPQSGACLCRRMFSAALFDCRELCPARPRLS